MVHEVYSLMVPVGAWFIGQLFQEQFDWDKYVSFIYGFKFKLY